MYLLVKKTPHQLPFICYCIKANTKGKDTEIAVGSSAMKQLLWNSGTSLAPGQDSQLLMSSEVAKRCQSGLFSVCLCLCEPQGLDGLSCPGSPVHHTPAASSPSEPHPGRWQSRICRGMGLPNMLKQHKPCNPGHDAVNSQGLKIKTSMVLQFKGNTD